MNKEFVTYFLSVILLIGSTILLTVLNINFELNYWRTGVVGLFTVYPCLVLNYYLYFKNKGGK